MFSTGIVAHFAGGQSGEELPSASPAGTVIIVEKTRVIGPGFGGDAIATLCEAPIMANKINTRVKSGHL